MEQLQEDLGRTVVEGVLMTGPRRLDVATALREAVEDRRLRIPPDADLRRDLHAVRAEAGPTGAPRLLAERSGTDGHADRFWALALACTAARERQRDHRGCQRRPPRRRPRGLLLIGSRAGDAREGPAPWCGAQAGLAAR